MAMNAPGYALPCGRDVETAWERLDAVAAGLADAHERTCPHCQGAHASLVVLRDATAGLAADEEAPPPGLTGRIMAAVRAEVGRREILDLPCEEPGRARISEQAVASVLRFAADTVPGVRARRCRVTPAGDDRQAIDVHLTLAVGYPAFAATALAAVRERVTAAAGARIGVRLNRLDLLVDDIYPA